MNQEKRSVRHLAAIVAADVAGYSRLTSLNEALTLRTLAAHRKIFDKAILKFGGRIANTAGDSVLAEFPSVVDALDCCIQVQRQLEKATEGQSEEEAVRFRIGIHIGDVVVNGTDLLGDAVNIAARLESVADPGGICVSSSVVDQADGKIELQFEPRGLQKFKNINRLVDVHAVALAMSKKASVSDRGSSQVTQTIRYCRSADDVRLAYSVVGSGPPLVKTANWLNHLELDWELPLIAHWLFGLSKHNSLLRYDARGNGLSDWDVKDVSLDAWVNDLEAVVNAANIDQFPLLGLSQGCAVSIAFAVRHPERVSRLILFGGFAQGRLKRVSLTQDGRARIEAVGTLMRLGWGNDDPTFRQLMTSQLMPTASTEQNKAFNELQRRSASPDCAVRYWNAVNNFDVLDLLPMVKVPTLVIHFRDDLLVPASNGRLLADTIPGAKFVSLPGRNHIPLEHDPGMPQFFEEVAAFLHPAH
jgi:class 3 adenylate cyclase/pimeloyl-ACP methyl ester carboxylesterase